MRCCSPGTEEEDSTVTVPFPLVYFRGMCTQLRNVRSAARLELSEARVEQRLHRSDSAPTVHTHGHQTRRRGREGEVKNGSERCGFEVSRFFRHQMHASCKDINFFHTNRCLPAWLWTSATSHSSRKIKINRDRCRSTSLTYVFLHPSALQEQSANTSGFHNYGF